MVIVIRHRNFCDYYGFTRDQNNTTMKTTSMGYYNALKPCHFCTNLLVQNNSFSHYNNSGHS